MQKARGREFNRGTRAFSLFDEQIPRFNRAMPHPCTLSCAGVVGLPVIDCWLDRLHCNPVTFRLQFAGQQSVGLNFACLDPYEKFLFTQRSDAFLSAEESTFLDEVPICRH